MRKGFVLGIAMSLLVAGTVNADPLAHYDANNGPVDVVGYEIYEKNDKTYLFMICDWTNTTEEDSSPSNGCGFHAFQNGIEIRNDYLAMYTPEGCYSYVTDVQPGYSLHFYYEFLLGDMSPVDVKINNVYDTTDFVSFTVDPSADGTPSEDTAEEAPAEDLEARVAELETIVADLEARLSTLENAK